MIKVYPAVSRYSVDLGWLRSNLSFSFGDYYDPNNSEFGVMRVCNDDYLAPGRGFGAHPHSDMEIVTVVLSGSIRHEDNLDNIEITSFGEVQRITAGSGIIHAEYNASTTEDLNVIQMWFEPRKRGLKPSYETSRFDPDQLNNALLPIVSHQALENVALVQQDMTLYLSKLAKGKQLTFKQAEGRKIFLFIIEGEIEVNGLTLEARDTARLEFVSELDITAHHAAFYMLIDLP